MSSKRQFAMRGYLVIRPNGGTTFIRGDKRLGGARMQSIIGGRLDYIALAPGLDMWIHDEGKFECDYNPAATAIFERYLGEGDVVFGTVLLAGVDGEGAKIPLAPGVIRSLRAVAATADHAAPAPDPNDYIGIRFIEMQ